MAIDLNIYMLIYHENFGRGNKIILGCFDNLIKAEKELNKLKKKTIILRKFTYIIEIPMNKIIAEATDYPNLPPHEEVYNNFKLIKELDIFTLYKIVKKKKIKNYKK